MLTLILLLQVTVLMDVEVQEPLKAAIRKQLRHGGVRVVTGRMIVSPEKGRVVLGVPRLVESTRDTVLTLKLIQTRLPGARAEHTVTEFNRLAFHLGFTDVVWQRSCDVMDSGYDRGYFECSLYELTKEFLKMYGTVPQAWPGDDEWALACDSNHNLCRDWVIKVGYENRNSIALPRTAHCEGHDS